MQFICRLIRSFAAFGSLVIALCSATYADEPQMKCISESALHNDIMGCYMEAFEQTDRQLNQMYQIKINALPKVKAKVLQDSQRSWLKLKEQICVADEANYGRESHFDAIQCEIDMTNERIEFLKQQK